MSHARRRSARLLALFLPLVLVAAACGGKKEGSGGGGTEDVGDPQRGGSVTYAVEAETNDGWCLPEAQLAISGIVVARSIFDTLTAPNADGEYVPYLAKTVEHSEDYKTWTIGLRDGVKFHDGSDLTAEVVKNNLDAYRGEYEARSRALLFRFVLDNIDTVEATDDLTVTVKTKVPWVAFPAFLYSTGRLGMVAQAQLDDEKTCDSKLIGTGPFKLKSWTPDSELVATANPDYWQEAPDGKPYPYLDEIRFTPVPEGEQRVNGVEGGEYDLVHVSGAQEFLNLRSLKEDGQVNTYESEDFAEVAFVQMNTSVPPMDDLRVRRAATLAVDREDYTEVINEGLFTPASGVFGKGSLGYLEDAGYPEEQDLEEAKRLVKEYEDENGPIEIEYQATPGAANLQVATYVQNRLKDIGVKMEITTVQQDRLIDNAINGKFEIQGFRNYPGGDPDELTVWFKSGSPVNFARINDPELDRLLEEGRSETDPDKRKKIYQDFNRQMNKNAWAVWANWTTWMVASGSSVHGFELELQPDLPDGSKPFTGLASGHPMHGLWVSE